MHFFSNKKLCCSILFLSSLSFAAVDIGYESAKWQTKYYPVAEFTEYYTKIKVTNTTVAPYRVGFRVYANQKLPKGTGPFQEGRFRDDPDGNKFSEYTWNRHDGLASGASEALAYHSYNADLDTSKISPSDLEKSVILLKTGACNEPEPRLDAKPITIEALKILLKDPSYYDEKYRYASGDVLGKHGGEYSAGIFDSFYGETQFQFAKPKATWSVSNTQVKFDEKNGGTGPSIWMGLSANQEYYGTDLQVLIASAMKESWLFTTGAAVQVGVTPYHIECPTYGDQIAGQFPSLYPFGLSCDAYLGGTAAYPTTDGPKAINAAMSSGFLWQSYYKQLNLEVDLAWKQVLENSIVGGDPLIGFCYMASMYNQGPGHESVHKLLLPDAKGGNLSSILDNPKGCEKLNDLLPNFGNYLTTMKVNANILSDASKLAETDASIDILDRWITEDDLKMFWFGEKGDHSTAAKSQDGGILLHYDMNTAERKAIWDKVLAAFKIQAAHWPAQGGKPVISLRYDWLSNLRVVKGDLNLVVDPSLASWRQTMVDKFSKSGVDANGQRIDDTYPFAKIQKPTLSGDFVFEVDAQDPFYVATDTKQQDRGIASVEWTAGDKWTKWNSTGVKVVNNLSPRTLGSQTTYLQRIYEVTVPSAEVAAIQAAGGADIYVKTTDLCGNSVINKTPIKGVVFPEITKVEMWDSDGDGKADSLFFNGIDKTAADGEKAIFSDFTSVSYTWNEKNFENVSTVGTYWVLDKTHDFADELITGSLTLKYATGDLKANIEDKIGPVITSASLKERSDNSAKDTLRVSFSKNISGVDKNKLEAFLEFFGKSSGLGAPEEILELEAKSIRMVYPANSINTDTDSVRISATGPLQASINNMKAHVNNKKVPIFLDKGPVPIDRNAVHGWYDTNGDGRMDQAELVFSRDIDEGRLSQMEFVMNWKNSEGKVVSFTKKGNDVKVDLAKVKISFASEDDIMPLLTHLPGEKDGVVWGEMQVTQPGENDKPFSEKVTMKDKMGAVLVKAYLKPTNNPESGADALRLGFSEPMENSDAVLDEQFQFKMEGVERTVTYSNKVKWHNDNSLLEIFFEPEHKLRPVIGDSVKILPGEQNGTVADKEKNTSHLENLYQVIDGKQVIKFWGPKLVETPKNHSDSDFGEAVYFDKGEFADSVIASNAMHGIGFEFTFTDKETSTLNRESFQLKYQIDVFDNLGQFVAQTDGELGCKDVEKGGEGRVTRLNQACDPDLFAGSRSVKVFIPWNMRSSAKETSVASGVYLLRAQAGTSRKGVTLIKTSDHARKIGVYRNSKSKGRVFYK